MSNINPLRTLTAVLFFLLTTAASGQSLTRSDVLSLVVQAQKRLLSDSSLIEKSIDVTYGGTISAEKKAISAQYMLQMIGHEKLPAYMVDILQPVITPETSRQDVQNYLFEGMLQLKVRGLRRLSQDQQASFFRFTIEMMDALPVDICKALVNGAIDSRKGGLLETRFAVSQSKEKFVDYMALQVAAANAELVKYPDLRVISEQQALITKKAHALAFERRVDASIPGLYERAAKGTTNARDDCLGARAYTLAGLDLREPYRGWFLTIMMDGLQ